MDIEENKDLDLQDIAERFRTSGRVKQVFPFGSGHINDTFKVISTDKSYLLQRVNQHVFMDVRGLTSNLIRVVNYLFTLIENKPGQMQVLIPVRTTHGNYFYVDEEAGFWRMFDFVEGAKSVDRAEGVEIAEEGGKAFGWFIKNLEKFPIASLGETISGFHNAASRLETFRKSVTLDRKGRVEEVKEEIQFLEERAQEMMRIHELGQEGKIPTRVVHNDTKINNVLFDHNNKAICVIDLDTVMPGYVLHDFGDAIRTFTNKADEDEKEHSNIDVNLEFFRAFAEGFLSETLEMLNPSEIENLAFSAKYVTWEQAVRFLTDYLKGDLYYKTSYPEHNLVRARAQIWLLERMENRFNEMETIIHEVVEQKKTQNQPN